MCPAASKSTYVQPLSCLMIPANAPASLCQGVEGFTVKPCIPPKVVFCAWLADKNIDSSRTTYLDSNCNHNVKMVLKSDKTLTLTFCAPMRNECIVVTREQDDSNAMRCCIGCKFREKGHRSTHGSLTSIPARRKLMMYSLRA